MGHNGLSSRPIPTIMSFLSVREIVQPMGPGHRLGPISFEQRAHGTLGIAGATGSGKSTLLKLIAGMGSPAQGSVWLEGERVKKVPEEKLIPGHPGIAYLSQHFELRNHYRMEELLGYANILGEQEAEAMYRICKIDHLLQRKSDQLSGGEKQRVALARLLVSRPRLLILDEPFSNLDGNHKNLLKDVLKELKEKWGLTLLLVSHEPADLLSLADEILVLEHGQIVEQGKPQELYYRPRHAYTAGLLGLYNEIPGPWARQWGFPGHDNGGMLCARPEEFVLLARPAKGTVPGRILQGYFHGPYWQWQIGLEDGTTLLVFDHNGHRHSGDKVHLRWEPGIRAAF